MMAIGFLGYVLPYGQMSLWGLPKIAPNAYSLQNFIFIFKECLGTIYFFLFIPLLKLIVLIFNYFQDVGEAMVTLSCLLKQDENLCYKNIRIKANHRIGPHNKEILSIIFGSLLGDAHAEKRIKGNGTRISFYQEGSHQAYAVYLHKLILDLNYCSDLIPSIKTRLGNKGTVRKIIKFNTWTYSSLNWVHELWYVNGVKIVPNNIGEYLTPLALAIWIMDDGGKTGSGLKLSTNSFTYLECIKLVQVLFDNFNLKASIQSAGVPSQYIIYIWKESMPLLREIVKPYVHPSMKYKLGNE